MSTNDAQRRSDQCRVSAFSDCGPDSISSRPPSADFRLTSADSRLTLTSRSADSHYSTSTCSRKERTGVERVGNNSKQVETNYTFSVLPAPIIYQQTTASGARVRFECPHFRVADPTSIISGMFQRHMEQYSIGMADANRQSLERQRDEDSRPRRGAGRRVRRRRRRARITRRREPAFIEVELIRGDVQFRFAAPSIEAIKAALSRQCELSREEIRFLDTVNQFIDN